MEAARAIANATSGDLEQAPVFILNPPDLGHLVDPKCMQPLCDLLKESIDTGADDGLNDDVLNVAQELYCRAEGLVSHE